MSHKKGVLYFAQGHKYLKEAILSAKSFKRHHKNIPICLKTPDKNFSSSVFDIIEYIEPLDHHFRTKVLAIKQTPFEYTLFIDTDTKICKPVNELFDFLMTYDLGVAYLPLCDWPANASAIFKDFVDYTMYNTGVLLYRQNDKINKFMDLWLESTFTHDMGVVGNIDYSDQTDFNNLIFDKKIHESLGISIVNLPNTIYNVRPWLWKPLKDNNQYDDIKILHAHGAHKSYLNQKYQSLRIVLKNKGILKA